MAQTYDNPADRRNKVIQSRLTEEEKDNIQAIADKYDRTVSDYVQKLIQTTIKQHRRFLGRLK